MHQASVTTARPEENGISESKVGGNWWGLIVVVPILAWAFYTWYVWAAERAARPTDDTSSLKAMLRERVATLREIAEAEALSYKNSRSNDPFEPVGKAHADLLAAELDLCDTEAEKMVLLRAAVARAKGYEDELAKLAQVGAATRFEGLRAKSYRLQAEITLKRLRLGPESPGVK
jgi:hypothetical protein